MFVDFCGYRLTIEADLAVCKGKGSTFISQLLYDPEYWFSIEPVTFRSVVKRTTDWANPVHY